MYIKSILRKTANVSYVLIDLICLNIAFVIAYKLRIGGENPYMIPLYRDYLIVICMSDMLVVNMLDFFAGIEHRGYYKEFQALGRQVIIVFLIGVLYLYSVKNAHRFSRLTMLIMAGLFFSLNYVCRLLWKRAMKRLYRSHPARYVLIIADKSNAQKVIDSFSECGQIGNAIKGIALTDDQRCESIGGIPVVCRIEKVPEYVCHNWVDDVLIAECAIKSIPQNALMELSETGVIIHIGLQMTSGMLGSKQFVESFGGQIVLTSCMNEASVPDMLLKRFFDIFVGIIGCIATGIVFFIIAPIIKAKSPGPVFFRQKRVGKNGKIFTMLKFRSMHMDAEERKNELKAENRIQDGLMFKLDFDPRIIGNEILPNGMKKTGIGEFIRKTSIDEIPQFINVLKGDMSFVGTRPPTLDEWEKYVPHHKARLSIKPGITGMWQVSGRSEITDFEDVVALDTEYINKWSLGLDIKIILKTFRTVLRKDGAL